MFAAAAAKSLSSCPTLSDPMDCSLPGSSVHGFSRQECWSAVSQCLVLFYFTGVYYLQIIYIIFALRKNEF